MVNRLGAVGADAKMFFHGRALKGLWEASLNKGGINKTKKNYLNGLERLVQTELEGDLDDLETHTAPLQESETFSPVDYFCGLV